MKQQEFTTTMGKVLNSQNPTFADYDKRIAELEAQNTALRNAANAGLRFKVSSKGGVSVYGLNARFPVTLYATQWQKLLDNAENIRKFIDANASQMSTKADRKVA